VVRAIEMGAQGYVSKGDDPRMLVKAVRKVAAGDNFISPQLAEAVTFSGASIKANPASQMTARELEILRLLGRGDKIVEVADALEISYKTVANTTSLLKQKLGAKNHSDLIRIAVEMGLGWRPSESAPVGIREAEPAAPRGRDPFASLSFAYRPGNGMTKASSAKGLPATMMTPFVVAAAPVPSVVVTASAVPMSVTVAASMLDLDHAIIRRGNWCHAQPGGSGYGHRQRGK
jgi:DNA-binding CsgD family transcriptional regulator